MENMCCLNCKRYTPNAFADSNCPFTKYNSYFSDFRQSFPHQDKWLIEKDFCSHFLSNKPVTTKRKPRHKKSKIVLLESENATQVLEKSKEQDGVSTFKRFF